MTAKLKTAVLGATGYAGYELTRLLLRYERLQKPMLLKRESGGGGSDLSESFPAMCGNGGYPLEPFSIEKLKHAGVDLLFLATPHAGRQRSAQRGANGAHCHGGRSRNEQIATDLRLYVRTTIDQIQGCLADWLSALLARAEKAGDAAMPAYTHTQPAEPVLVSHWLLAYVEMFLRDSERLTDCRVRLNLCPLGSGAVAGATVALDRGAIAADLGFDASTANSLDATSDRDFALEFVQVLSILALHLSRWAEEMILFSTQEYGFVSLPEPFSTGSSAMPQKKNADLLELARAKAARVLGASTTLLVTVKGLPLAYSKDMRLTFGGYGRFVRNSRTG